MEPVFPRVTPEEIPDSDGNLGTITLPLPEAARAKQGAAIAAQLSAWWC